MEKTYKVDGMTCGGCVRSVERALSAALPTTRIAVSLENNEVRIAGEHEASAVEKAIEGAGFDFGGAAAPHGLGPGNLSMR